MWDPRTGIEVQIKPYGSNDAYFEYKAKSTSSHYAKGRNEIFIEAVTDERYVVRVIVWPVCQWGKSRDLWVDYELDGGDVQRRTILSRPQSAGQNVTDTLSSFEKYIDGTYTRCGLTFAPSLIGTTTSVERLGSVIADDL